MFWPDVFIVYRNHSIFMVASDCLKMKASSDIFLDDFFDFFLYNCILSTYNYTNVSVYHVSILIVVICQYKCRYCVDL